ncbi:MAG: YcaQ family DNA glycosylase [Alphaproteobacteria bacterium]|nr:YcaQ family DNA glycosylase [Alphaproteobacteria bacterium]
MNKAPFVISNEKARALILAQHGLSGVRQEGGADAVAPLVRKLGYVQLDSIRIIERAHHHILYSRHTGYKPRHLDRLQAKTPALFEQWTHDSSLIPMEFYPHWRHRFAAARKRKDAWYERIGDVRAIKTVREHIEKNGAARARDFAHLGGRTGPWWGWGPAKASLEWLWRTGELAVLARDGFEKIYDLSERSIPQHYRDARPTKAETNEWALNAALDRLGAGTARMITEFWATTSLPESHAMANLAGTRAWIEREKKAARLIDVVLEAAPGRRPFQGVARPDIEDAVAKLPVPTSRLRVLSPFDPVLRDRTRAERIFGFDYTIEIFVPGPKRKYGYYVFPLIEGDRFVGRIDMKAERVKDALAVKALWMEKRLSLSKARQAKLERELARQAKLGQVRDIIFPASALKTG